MDCKEKENKKQKYKEKISNLTSNQMNLIHDYTENEMRKLKLICNPIIASKHLPNFLNDDIYSDALNVLLESVVSFDESKGVPFQKYLEGNIGKSSWQWSRDSRRLKRCNVQYGANGKPLKDENGNFVIIPNESLDADNDDGIDLVEKVSSDFNIDDEVNVLGENITKYMNSLGDIEKKIAEMFMNGYSSKEIKEDLGISSKQYSEYLADMKSYDKKKLLKIDGDMYSKEEPQMNTKPMTSEKTKNTSYSIESISKKLNRYKLRADHPLQRHSGQWNSITKSELVSDVLQGNSLTPIIISEEIKDNVVMHWIIDGKQRCTNLDDFLNDGFVISKKIQRRMIPYQTDKRDENGNIILNEDGFPIPEVKIFDIGGKKFSQLPEELQDVFKEYQYPVMLNLNCTKKDIAYDIARFNRCRPMNVAQNGWTGLEETFAEYVDNILKLDFFKPDCDKSSYTLANSKNGSLRRMIVESIITSNYIDNFDKNFRNMCEFLTDTASEGTFIDFYVLIDKLAGILDSSTASLFTAKDSFLWFALFNKFTTLGRDDVDFVDFAKEFISNLHNKEIDGVTFDELNEKGGTKDKCGIKRKITHLIALMNEYLGESIIVDETVTEEELSDFEFVKENVSDDVNEEDFEFYKDMVDDSVKCDTPLYEKCTPALIALMAIACQEEKDTEFESWAGKYAKDNITFSPSQKVNFMYMKNDFEKYCQSAV